MKENKIPFTDTHKNPTVTFRLNKELLEILNNYCKNNKIQRQELLKVLIIEHLFESELVPTEHKLKLSKIGYLDPNAKNSPIPSSLNNPEIQKRMIDFDFDDI
ncbi:hypothetical protein WEU38_18210 (plasmid) [Cyanobacterium aponinum AL20118]|uniref:Uncharacterized protein n=1 Tax=Cyanobacterium aponinum AL20115 TaxID=3090662 RepID=A0AAF0ZHS4_9CHRO|nr:hypothetical protein [Cyanobacterium aponinum]WPF90507.1 hypothetical protein SAY89_18305 [Cyanobacterium aponinum AL20115]